MNVKPTVRAVADTVVNLWRTYAPCTVEAWGDALVVAFCAWWMLAIACGWLR